MLSVAVLAWRSAGRWASSPDQARFDVLIQSLAYATGSCASEYQRTLRPFPTGRIRRPLLPLQSSTREDHKKTGAIGKHKKSHAVDETRCVQNTTGYLQRV